IKKDFRKWIRREYTPLKNDVVYLNDNCILDNKYTGSDKKNRPYLIQNEKTENNKMLLVQYTTKNGTTESSLIASEPITGDRYKVFKCSLKVL
ncbi:MAG: hypothetical protein HRS57_03365, partial [Mycoplasmataceae bacterium]|nr:hypothetical protein [Mycoplasmataceae bacterium]